MSFYSNTINAVLRSYSAHCCIAYQDQRLGDQNIKEERISFFSEGDRLAGILRLPDSASSSPWREIVQGPGWLGLKDAKPYLRYHDALTEAGFAVLILTTGGSGSPRAAPICCARNTNSRIWSMPSPTSRRGMISMPTISARAFKLDSTKGFDCGAVRCGSRIGGAECGLDDHR